MRLPKFFGIAALLIAGAVLVIPIWRAREVSAEGDAVPAHGFLVSRIEGSLACRTAGESAWRELNSGDSATDAQSIRLSPNGYAEIVGEFATLRLRGGARASIRPSEPPVVELSGGQLHVDSRRPLSVVTPYGSLSVDGEAIVACEDARAVVSVLRGTGEISERNGKPAVQKITAGTAAALTQENIQPAPYDEAAFKHFTIEDAPPKDAPPTPTPTPTAGRGMGRLVLHDSTGRETQPMELQEMRIHAQIFGPVAMTEVEQTFYNPTDQRAEGTFYFPLPAGASISRVAMYIDGTLMEGELVERVQARMVYEEIVRKMRDPLLMEWQEGNIFKTRIFPIQPRSPKRVLISYTELLPAVNGERCYVYPLVGKMTQTGKIGRFEAIAELNGISSKNVRSSSADGGMTIDSNEIRTRITLERKDFRPTRDFVLRFNSEAHEPMQLFTDRRTGEDGFFLLSYTAGKSAHAQLPEDSRDVVLLFDTSLSRRADDYRAQLAVARTLLQELNPNDRFAIIPFDVAARPLNTSYASGSAAARDAFEKLAHIVPLGATNVEAAVKAAGQFLDANRPRGRTDIVCISDGIATIGETVLNKLLDKALPVLNGHQVHFNAVAMGATQDRLLLSELCRRTGGLFRTIMPGDDIERDAFQLALALGSELTPAPEFAFNGGETYDVFPKAPGALRPGEELLLVGRYKNSGKLSVSVKVAGSEPLAANFELPESNSQNVLVPRVWAREQLDALLLDAQSPEVVRRITELSQEFTLITPYTSFLVLENEQAYETWHIDRKMRRCYWEEIGKLRSAPPRGRAPIASTAPAVEQEPKNEECVPNFDLVCASARLKGGRVISTALSTLCLEIYYRYRQLSADSGPTVTGAYTMVVPQDILARAELGDHFETINTDAHNFHSVSGQNDIGGGGFGGVGLEDVIGGGDKSAPGTGGGWGGGSGTGVGVDAGSGWSAYGQRSGGGRRLMVMRHGGSRATESGADAGLNWLEAQQKSDGSWGSTEETSLALLAFVGAGHTEKVGSHKDTVKKAVAWLIAQQHDAGRIGANTYEQALATLALSESAGMARVATTGEAAQKAVVGLCSLQLKVAGQLDGWGLAAEPDALISAWSVAALKSAKIAGLHVEHEAFEGALSYLEKIDQRDPGWRTSSIKLGAIGLARVFLGFKREDEMTSMAAESLLARVAGSHLEHGDSLYVRYFGTLLTFQYGGDYWRKWNEWNRHTLVPAQSGTAEERGSWAPMGIELPWRNLPEEGPIAESGMELLNKAFDGVNIDKPGVADYDKFSGALITSHDADVFNALLEKLPAAAPGFKALVHARIAYLRHLNGKLDESAKEYLAAFNLFNRSEDLLQCYVEVLLEAHHAPEALAFFMKIHSEAMGSEWIDDKIVALLMDPECGITDTLSYLSAQLKPRDSRDVALKHKFGRQALVAHPAAAAAILKQAYEESDGQSDEILSDYIAALRKDKRAPEALALLVNGARKSGSLTPAQFALFNDLLFDPAAGVADAAAFVRTELAGKSAVASALLALVADRQAAGKQLEEALKNYKTAYELSNKADAYGRKYFNALLLNGETTLALSLLKDELRESGSATPWRIMATFKCILADPKLRTDVAAFAEENFAQQPEVRGSLELLAARSAMNGGDTALANQLYRRAYETAGRPVEALQPFIGALISAGEFKSAAVELERCIQGGFHTPWAFQTLADAYAKQGLPLDTQMRAISSEVELFPKEAQPRIDLAQRFEALGEREAALQQYMEAVRIRPEDPYFYKQVIERAVALSRFDIAREALLNIQLSPALDRAKDQDLIEMARKVSANDGKDAKELEAELRKAVAKDLVVAISWDTPNTDVDLHVIEPSGEECDYNHKVTASGGWLDHDVTNGFGPETYALRRARAGAYRIAVHYYNGQPRTTVTIQIYRNRNSDLETLETRTVVLEKKDDKAEVAVIEVK